MENIIRENRINPPLPRSYQLRTRHALEELNSIFHQCADKNNTEIKEILVQTKENLDVLAWKADKQVQALKSKIQWLEEIIEKTNLTVNTNLAVGTNLTVGLHDPDTQNIVF